MTDRQAIKGMLPERKFLKENIRGYEHMTKEQQGGYLYGFNVSKDYSADALLKRVVSGKLLERKLETSICKSCEGWGKCIDRKRCKYLISMRRRIVHALRKEFLILRRFR